MSVVDDMAGLLSCCARVLERDWLEHDERASLVADIRRLLDTVDMRRKSEHECIEAEVQRLNNEVAELARPSIHWLHKLRAVAVELGCQSLADVLHEVRCKLAELAEARAIIAKLPKTKDGVPIAEGQEVFFPDMLDQDFLMSPVVEYRVYWVTHDGQHITDSVADWYSTRAAAEEAGNAKR